MSVPASGREIAKGGEKGPDLLRSVLVLDDENGNAIGPVILRGRPDNHYPFTWGAVGILTTAGKLLFTGDGAQHLVAFDPANGNIL